MVYDSNDFTVIYDMLKEINSHSTIHIHVLSVLLYDPVYQGLNCLPYNDPVNQGLNCLSSIFF